jgi:hypothetical protein
MCVCVCLDSVCESVKVCFQALGTLCFECFSLVRARTCFRLVRPYSLSLSLALSLSLSLTHTHRTRSLSLIHSLNILFAKKNLNIFFQHLFSHLFPTFFFSECFQTLAGLASSLHRLRAQADPEVGYCVI